jgi:hypothetical protein
LQNVKKRFKVVLQRPEAGSLTSIPALGGRRSEFEMKKFLLLLALASVGALASVTAAQAGNTTVTVTTTQVNFTDFVPCANDGAGEYVDFSGIRKDLFRTTVNGNTFSQTEQENFQGHEIGTGETTGDTYRDVGAAQLTSTGSFTNGQSTETFALHAKYVGGGVVMTFSLIEHVTTNANGDVTVSFDNLSIVCS